MWVEIISFPLIPNCQKEGKNNLLIKSFYLVYNTHETTQKNLLNRLPITGQSVIMHVIFTC
jgi:hypothetical protein